MLTLQQQDFVVTGMVQGFKAQIEPSPLQEMRCNAQLLCHLHTFAKPTLYDAGQLIFVPSYFDYVRLRNFLKEEEAHFAGLSEYAAPKEAARGRSLFADGRLRLALLTERSHFYHRARVRGVKVGEILCFSAV